ncbi:sensor histidine kinase [Pseudomonas cavernicola]|uniref:histidine kinase n=1 Tax=Pseudomonas cavernicola TaxID=2320866 RepID=A0A418XQ02_9PSED|nr:ATP-binding protein [Pseudomonas cavernicola]RJG14592.1 sensor histidine kinase [Pseudomonas cavernicola]
MRSIQRRLSLGLISVLLVVVLLLAQTSLWLFDLGLRRYLEAVLRVEAESLLIALVRGPQGIQLDEQRLAPSYRRPFSGHYFRIDFAEEVWRSRSLWDLELARANSPGLQADLEDGPRGQLLLVYRGDYRRFGQQLSISVAEDYSPVLASFRRAQYLSLGLGLGALVLILLLQRLTVRNALRPLEQARQQIAQLQQGQRGQLDSQVPQELEPLVAQINHLLAHTEDTLTRSRNALGNLGHALKTPLAVLLSLASREELNAYPELQATLREQLAQIEQRLSRELGRARLAGEALPGAQFDCAKELPGLFATLAMIHDRDLKLAWEAAPGLRLPWDREDLLELLGNLLDNACKWAESEVSLSITVEPSGFRLWVDDDGPGILADNREAVLGRGARLDEQVAGHGLGLGIVRDIVEAWNGRLQLLSSPLGGLRVSIELPSRPARSRESAL